VNLSSGHNRLIDRPQYVDRLSFEKNNAVEGEPSVADENVDRKKEEEKKQIKNRMRSSELRMLILLAFKKVWENNPDERAYAITDEVWKPIWNENKARITPEFGTAVFASLNQDGLIESIAAPNPEGKQVSLCRITDKGLEFISTVEEAKMTRRLALIGAVTGCLGIIISVIGLFLS
jgi:hypothetical protein